VDGRSVEPVDRRERELISGDSAIDQGVEVSRRRGQAHANERSGHGGA
jgi:hypothetical protein